eukprot:351732-Chlamydomonas_euryale.AAC.15
MAAEGGLAPAAANTVRRRMSSPRSQRAHLRCCCGARRLAVTPAWASRCRKAVSRSAGPIQLRGQPEGIFGAPRRGSPRPPGTGADTPPLLMRSLALPAESATKNEGRTNGACACRSTRNRS